MEIKKLLYKYKILKTPGMGIGVRKLARDTKQNIFNVFDDWGFNEKQDEVNAYGLSQKTIDALLQEMIRGNRITDGSFLYARDKHDPEGKDNGAAKFSAIAESPLYKKEINDKEKTIFKDNILDIMIHEISKDKKTHIELGPETGEKFLRYSDEWDPEHNNLRGKKYLGIDVSGVYVDMANKNVKKIGMIGESVPGDRFEHSLFDREKNQIYYFFGGSIGNLDVGKIYNTMYGNQDKTIINLLMRMRANTPFSSVPAVITYFEAPDKESPTYKDSIDKLLAIYGSKNTPYYDEKTHNAAEDFVLSGFESLGLERSKLEFVVECEESYGTTPITIKSGVKFKERTEIQIGKSKVVKEKGQCIRAIKSQRFTKEGFENIAKDAGFTVKYQKSHKGVVVAILQSKLGMNDRFIKGRNISYLMLIASVLLGGGILTKNILHQKDIHNQQKKMDNEFASKQKMIFYGNDHGYYELKTDAEKVAYINRVIDEVFANIVMRYNVKSNETDIKKDIKIYIKDKEVLGRFSNTTNYTNNIFTIADEFVQKYSDILIEKNADRAPYDHLREYEQYFKDIITDKTILDKNIVHIRKGKGLEWDKSYVFAPSNDRGIYFNIQLQCIQNGTKSTLVEEKTISVEGKTEMDIRRYLGERIDVVSHCIKDGYLYVKTWKDTIYSYIEITSGNEDNKKTIDPTIIAYDYFYQNRPIIPEVYKRFGAIYRDKSKNYNRENDNTYRWKKDTIKKLIIRDMLETGTLDKLPIDNDKLIFLYLQGFVKRNADALQKEGISINPYADYQTQYAEALENTGTTQDKAVPEKITYEEREKYDFHYAGKFYTQTGDEYDVAEVTIAGVKYLYARNIAEDNNTYHTAEGGDIKVLNYYFSRGKEVAKKYNKSQKISDEASDAIAKNINIQTNKLINSIHNKKPDSRSKGFNPGLVKR